MIKTRKAGAEFMNNQNPSSMGKNILTLSTARHRSEVFIQNIRAYPGGFQGRGIVICGGGVKYFVNAWIALRIIRKLGCALPVQIWHLGPHEIDARMRAIASPYNVEFVDAHEVRKLHPARILNGWELKPFSILHSTFAQVLLLDADNIPVVSPDFLFDTSEFQQTGAIFWPDFGHLKQSSPIWDICGISYRDEPEWEAGQIVIDKMKCWRALQLTMWYNEHSGFYYQYILGDKDTYHLAFRKLDQPVSMPAVTVKALKSTLCQHDFNGRRIFQHRVGDKWSLEKENERIWGFQYEADCREFLRELKVTWFGKAEKPLRFESNKCSQKANELAQEIMDTVYRYERVGFDSRRMTFNYDGLVGQGAGACEAYWDLKEKHGKMALLLSSKTELICELGRNEFGTWEGKWLRFERMPVRLTPVRNTVSELSRNEKRRNSRRKPQFILVSDDSGDFLSKCAVETYSILSSMGFDVRFATQKSVNSNKSVSQTKKSKISPSEWNLLFHLPTRNIITSQRTVWVTSWNSLHLSTEMANSLNTADGILVPSEWNATCFSCASVIKPIGVAAPGIDTEIFRYAPMNVEGPCVFGIIEREAGLANHSTAKKMIDLFLTTFPKQNGVILKLICPQTTLTVSDPRIEIMRDHITDKKLAHWLRDITCLISIDQLEGWPTLRF